MDKITEVTQEQVNKDIAKENEKVAEMEQETLTGLRKYQFVEKEVFLKFPTAAEQTDIECKMAKIITKFLRQGELMSRQEMLDMLEKRGVWTSDNENELQDLQLKYDDYNKEAYSWEPDNRVGNQEYIKLLNLRHETYIKFMTLFGRRERLLEYSIEKMAEKEVIPYQVFLCVVDKERNKIFKNIDELINYTNGMAVTRLVAACIAFWQGGEERFLEKSLENLGGKEDTDSSKTE